MTKHNVEVYVPMHVPAASARDAVMGILDAVVKRRAPYEHVMLTMGLRDLHIPFEGTVSVPVTATVEARPMRWECHLRLEAEENRSLFPCFDGTLTITPNGRDASELWLQGDYEPPLGNLGAGTDAALLHGAAEGSLRAFLTWLASDVTQLIEAHERDAVRASRQMHS